RRYTDNRPRNHERVAFEVCCVGLSGIELVDVSPDLEAFVKASAEITKVDIAADLDAIGFEQTFGAGKLTAGRLWFDQRIDRRLLLRLNRARVLACAILVSLRRLGFRLWTIARGLGGLKRLCGSFGGVSGFDQLSKLFELSLEALDLGAQ